MESHVGGAKDTAHHAAECRKKSRESGHGVKTRVTKEDHFNAAVYLFSMFENGHDLDMVNPDNESKEDEDVQPAVVDVGTTEPINLGEPSEALPLRTEPDCEDKIEPEFETESSLATPQPSDDSEDEADIQFSKDSDDEAGKAL
ncbi:hypothetical protein DYB32_010609 [Aphanomyces invadans]|uniref:Uncharacterized protein n=1 Tax=Aphanomyces invadans TaxID=157072 RepID=A0A418AFJ9_9STRA|nr:hypothetical protein DYB32_010609 [Aphanomyces invadans]